MKNKLRRLFFYNHMEDSRLCLVLHWLINLAFLGLWSLGIAVAGMYLGAVNYGPELFRSYFQYTWLLLLNILPGAMLALLFWALTNRLWAGLAASGAVVLGLGITNHYKLMFRDDPILASDFANINEAAQISGNYSISLSPQIILIVALFALSIVLALFFMKARWRRALPRLVSLVLITAAAVGLYLTAYTSDRVYDFTSNLKVSFASGYKMSQWNDTDQYCCRGFAYPFVHSLSELVSHKPEGYDREEAEEALASLGSSHIPEDKKVNVVAVMLEAYCDLSKFEAITIGETDPYRFFNELRQESVSGSLITNIFAGGTIDTERTFLTGSSKMYEYRAPADSFVRYLSAQGYYTEFAHPGYDWFYNRRNVAEYLGFDAAYFNDDRYTMGSSDEIMRDDAFFADLRNLYAEATGEMRPYFSFSVTYHNHGPYAADHLYDPETEYIERGTMSEESYNIISNYLWGIKLTDDSLREFIDSFRNDSEAVVVVLFGDHKPWLGDNSSVYSELGIDLSRGSDESFYNYYETPYVIWANDAAKETLGNDFTGDGGSISPCFLMMKLFDLCSWEGEGYMQSLRAVYESGVSVINSSGRYMEKGVLTSSLSPLAQEKLELMEALQYYRMQDMEVEQ